MQVITCKISVAVSAAIPKSPIIETPSTRQRLLEAARAEFGDKGIESATTRGIAERAGCNEVTLFRHFESKQKLLAAVVQETSEEFSKLCECHGDFSGDPREDLTRFARVYNESLERCEGMARAMIGESRRRPTLGEGVDRRCVGAVSPQHRVLSGAAEKGRAGARRAGYHGICRGFHLHADGRIAAPDLGFVGTRSRRLDSGNRGDSRARDRLGHLTGRIRTQDVDSSGGWVVSRA